MTYRKYKERQNLLEKISCEREDNSDKISVELEQWVRRMRCNGFNEKGIRMEQFEDIQVGVSDEEVTFGSPSFEPYPDVKMEKCVYEGERDKGNRFHGTGSVLFEEDGSTMKGCWEHGVRAGHFKIVTNRNCISCIEGDYMDDNMNGKVKIMFNDKTWMEGFFKDGILHGFCRYFNAQNRLTFVGMHKNGKPTGTCWMIVGGGGCVVGRVDTNGKLSGPDIAYIYPDFKTVLAGVFDNGIMVRARHCNVINWKIESKSLKVPTYSDPTGSVFKREISTIDFVTLSPTLKDPYETNTIKVRISSLPGASEGIFARSDIQTNTILAFYHGIKLPSDYEEEESWDENAYKIFDPSNTPHGALDILEKHRSTTHYSASLAHKTNHSFLPNSQFLVYDHPRWGLVPCIASTRPIEACEEIFVSYGYDLDWCPDWYADDWNTGQGGVFLLLNNNHVFVGTHEVEVVKAKNTMSTIDDVNDPLPDMAIT